MAVADRSDRLSQAMHDMGVDSCLTMLDSQRLYFSTQQGLTVVRLSQLINQETLYKVLGDGGV
jgi:multidrug efflux system outer membrane protein